jgi:tetratricopeptide (TPR) repeat protein
MVVAVAGLAWGKGGGGRGAPGNHGNQKQSNQPTPEEQAEQTREKADQLLDDGFAALKAFDTASALEDFSDALQLEPDDALAHIGLGLSRAQKGKFPASVTEFSTAMSYARKAKENPPKPVAAKPAEPFFANQVPSDKPEPKPVDLKAQAEANLRLATFDLAVAYSRASEKPRALVLLDRMMTEKKPPDEMIVNAQRTLIASIDERSQAAIGALPGMLKNLETFNNFLRLAHSPLRRWGVTWMESNEVTRHRTSRETEPLPQMLPFLLPDDAVLPEGRKPDVALVNPLLPVVMTGSDIPPAPAGTVARANAPTTAPTTAPMIAGQVASAAAPATQPAAVERTITGAAFAVAPDMLLTVGRLAVGAKSLTLQTVDGTNYTATLAASDDATGMALLKVEGGHFPALALAGAARAGSVSIPAFTKPGVFGPELQVLSGELTSLAGLWSLRVSTYPRSPGSPLLNSQGQVVAVLVATRDDTLTKLPVVTIDAIRKFVDGKVGPSSAGAATSSQLAVLEVSATREQ